jgi:hypothetical protein
VAVLLSRSLRAKLFSRTSLAETSLFATLVLIPLLLNLALMRRQGAFYLRYCLTSQVALYILVAVLLAVQFRCSRLVAGIASVLMLAMIVRHDVSLVLRQPHPRNAAFLSTIRPDLPVVVGSGMTFVEMNHYEDPDFLKRVYYLKNRTAELRYEHSTYFEDYEAMDDLKMAFPIMSAPVEAYGSFVRQHREFLLFTSDYDWILHQLRADGASLTQISLAGAQTPYRESRELYLVKMPSGGI